MSESPFGNSDDEKSPDGPPPPNSQTGSEAAATVRSGIVCAGASPEGRGAGVYASWGRISAPGRQGIPAAKAGLGRIGGRHVLPYGNGRSYGDTCLNGEGVHLDSRSLSSIRAFDAATGLIEAEAGVMLHEIVRLAAPHGWFLPVTPGTQFVTLGGAVANDVHGKNHHRRGTFGAHVLGFTLERSDRGLLECGSEVNAGLFAATIGGLGLTGLIRRVTLRLMKVPSLTIRRTVTRFDRLADYFALAEEADERHEYAVAWIDSLAAGRSMGRGHLIAGDHAPDGDRTGIARAPFARVPVTPPMSPLAGLPLRVFNALHFRGSPRGRSIGDTAFDGFFYPLDRVGEWNRLYGPRGLHQHQSVVPLRDAQATVAEMTACARAHGQGSFLTVLKRFGSVPSPGLMSFPMPGCTLTLDFPHRGAKTLSMLADLDRITIAAGGRVNPYKDARMSPESFAASFPQWRALEAARDPAILSDFWRRTAMRLTRPAAKI